MAYKSKKCLFIGNFYSNKILDLNQKNVKLSLGNDNYEKNFISVLKQIYGEVICVSSPAIPARKKNPISIQEEDYYEDESHVHIIGFKYSKINYLFKREKAVFKEIKNICKRNPDINTFFISTYNLFFLAKKLKKYYKNCNIGMLLPDLPNVSIEKRSFLYGRRMNRLHKTMSRELKFVDLFFPITEHMMSAFGKECQNQYVYESFFDARVFNNINKNTKKQILYAGNINQEYGIKELINAFINSKNSCEYKLVVCGDGNYRRELIGISKKNPKIEYLGQVPHDKVLKLERESYALIVPDRDDRKYSFHSRYLEYLASGTTVITYKPSGAKKEYLDYFYLIENNGNTLENALKNALVNRNKLFEGIGNRARYFMLEQKNIHHFAKEIEKVLEKYFKS